jgi:acyl carrier protein
MELFLGCLGILIVIALAAVPFSIWESRKRNKEVNAVFAGRQELDDRDFYEKYFQAQGIPYFIVQKIRTIFAEELNADMSRLSAEDDFSKNLSFFWEFDSLADVEIVMRLEEEFQIKLTSEDLQDQFRTVDGMVNLVWRKVREKEKLGN